MRRVIALLAALLHFAAAGAQPVVPSGAPIPYGMLGQTGGPLVQGGSAPVDTNTVMGRTLSARAHDVINVKDYGAKCDGTTDDTAAINNAEALAGAADLVFPAGICVFSSKLAFAIYTGSVIGAGPYATTLLYDGASTTTDLVTVGFPGTSTSVGPGYVGGFRIASSTKMTGGTALHAFLASNFMFKDIILDGPGGNGNLYNGFWFDRFDQIHLDDYYAVGANDALRVSAGGVVGGASAGPQFDLWATHGKLAGSAVGVHIGGGVDNVYFDDGIATSNTKNVLIDTAISGVGNQEIGLGPTFVLDQANTDNVYINDSLINPAYYATVTIAGPVTHAKSGGNGITINAWPGGQVIVKSPYILANSASGIEVLDNAAYLSVSPETIISTNNYGIGAAFPGYTRLLSTGQVFGNTAGQYNANIALPTGMPVGPSTVAALPPCGSAQRGLRLTVTDANSPSFLAALSGGGSTVAPAVCNGTAWVAG